ncbi:MAG: hypothetical protein L0221_07955, partial [Chloroflexi bacterium]|nr:hypothetical protein [Chloroflexota bacterium]
SAINDLGNAVGNVGPIAGQQGFFWTPGGGMAILPDPIGGTGVFIEDVNDANGIVGFATVSGVERALLWNAVTTPVDLGDLDGDGGASAAFGLNDAGWIVGSSDDGGEQRAFRRDPITGVLQGLDHLPGGDFSRARDVNASGVVVGSAWDPASFEFHAVLWDTDGTVYDLHDLLLSGTGWVLEEALAISDTGYVVGTARNAAGEPEGFLLLPIPEPGTALLALLGLTLLALRRGTT